MTEIKKFFTGSAAELIPRDQWQRPLIIPVGGGKPVGYQRCTTFVNVLEDLTNLTKWKQRQTMVGLINRPALQMAVAAAKGDKNKLNSVADQAMEAAGGTSDNAMLGTAIHRFTEAFDNLEDISDMPPMYRPDLDAYAEATRHFENVAVEQFVVIDELKVAGTMDRLVRYNGQLYVADVKTGSIEWGLGKIAMQLAVYAHGVGYDPETGERISLGPINQTSGIVIHLPAGTGTCELVWVNLQAGWEACTQLAVGVHAWRKRKDLSKPFIAPEQVPGQQALELPAAPPAAVTASLTASPEPVGQGLSQVLAAADAAKQAAGVAVQERTRPATQAQYMNYAGEINAALLQSIDTARDVATLNLLWEMNQTVWETQHTTAAKARRAALEA